MTMKTRQPATFTLAQQADLFDGYTLQLAPLRAVASNGTKLRPAVFRVLFGGNVFHLDQADQELTRDAWKAFVNLRRLT
jgi:hypothetical protein